MPGTVTLHRVLRAPPERVYRAFVDTDALTKWLPPHGFVGKVHEMDARVGGGYRMSFTNLGTGKVESFSARYTELVENRKIVHADRFDDPALAGEMSVTVELEASVAGTVLRVVQQGIPDVIPVDFCYLGWQDSLAQLAQLVEPEIPDG
ncbi:MULTISPECIES: SRPBCC family protein [unclassified Luteimonas]